MIRIKRGTVAKHRRRKILKINRGFQASYRSLFRVANQKYIKAKVSSYNDRKKRKRLLRNLWVHRINSALRLYGLSFNRFIYQSRQSKIKLNRKVVSQLTVYDPDIFLQELRSFYYKN